MNLLITYAVLEVIAIIIVVSLCVAARRADRKTDQMLSPEEVAARHEAVDVHPYPNVSTAAARQTTGRWLTGLFTASTRNPTDRSLF